MARVDMRRPERCDVERRGAIFRRACRAFADDALDSFVDELACDSIPRLTRMTDIVFCATAAPPVSTACDLAYFSLMFRPATLMSTHGG